MRPASEPIRALRVSGFRLSVLESWEAGARTLSLDRRAGFEERLARAPRIRGGRASNRLLESPLWPAPVRIRLARRGGLLGRWLEDRYLSASRSHRELSRWQTLYERGVALPRPVLSASRRDGIFWRHALGAEDRPEAIDGADWIEQCRASGEPGRLEAGAAEVGRALRRLHDADALHGDLQLRNLLFEACPEDRERPWRCWLVDLDRTRLLRSVSPAARLQELMRLARSIEKLGHARCLTPRTRSRLLSGYCAGDRALRRAMRRAAPREIRRLRRHRISWRLRGGLGVGAALLAGIALLATACSDPSPGVAPGAGIRPDGSPRLSLLAVGDTGRSNRISPWFEGQRAVAAGMIAEDRGSPVDAVVLLGDNFYWHGLDRAHLVERVRENLVAPYCHFLRLTGPRSDEVRDACRVAPSERHPVPIHAVLGNHDLELPESAQLQREAVPEFLPDWNMSAGLAEVVELGEGVSLILFESEVAITDRAAIHRALVEAVDRAEGPWRILATHRPIATDDQGGLPRGGYPAFVHDALADAGAPVQLVLAGHHHSLQAFELRTPTPLLQVGLGSGSRAEPPLADPDHPHHRFGALELGFGRIDLIGEGPEERLAVSIHGTAPWPWLAGWWPHRLLARFEVDRRGHLLGAEGREP